MKTVESRGGRGRRGERRERVEVEGGRGQGEVERT